MAQIPSQNCTFCSKIAALYCYDCQQCLCTQCQKNIHDIVAVCRDHKVGDIHKAGNRIYKSVPTCEAHNKEFICYCGKCDCLTCKECITSSHNGHITKEIKNIADIRRKDVDQIINKLKTKVKEIKETLKIIDGSYSLQIQSDCDSYISNVEKTYQEIRQIIDHYKLINITTATDFREIEKQDLKRKRVFYQRLDNEYSDRLLKFENLLQEPHDGTFFTEWKCLQTELQIMTEESEQQVSGPKRNDRFNQDTFIRAVIEDFDNQFQMGIQSMQHEILVLEETLKKEQEDSLKKLKNEKQLAIAIDHYTQQVQSRDNEIQSFKSELERKENTLQTVVKQRDEERTSKEDERKQKDEALKRLKEQEKTVVRLAEGMEALKDELKEKQVQIDKQSSINSKADLTNKRYIHFEESFEDQLNKTDTKYTTKTATEKGHTQKSTGISSLVFKFIKLHKKQLLDNFLSEYKVQIKMMNEEVFLIGDHSYVQVAVVEFAKSTFVIKKWSCEVTNPADIIGNARTSFQQLESEFVCSIEVEPVVGNLNQQQVGQWVNWGKGLHIVMVYGKFCEISADVIVCPTSETCRPSFLGKTILEKGGNAVQSDFLRKRSTKIDPIFLSMETGDLFCVMLAHVAVPKSTSGDMKQKMISFLKNLILTVDTTQQQSMAIPLLMSDEVAELTLIHWLILALKDTQTSLSNLKEIYLCSEDPNFVETAFDVLKDGFENCDLFSYSFKHLFENPTDVLPSVQQAKIAISLVKGSLVTEKVDALVNSCGTDLNLNNGVVSNQLLNAAGITIQNECTRRYPRGINIGDVVCTNAGKLQAKNIYHCALPPWIPAANFSSQVLEKIVFECLMNAKIANCKTIAFPVFGTGKLLYPWESVAKTMIKTVQKYGRMHSDTCVEEVRIVLYEKDLKSIEAFESEKVKAEQLMMIPEDPMPPKMILESRCRNVRMKVVQQSELKFHHSEALVIIYSLTQIETDANMSKLKHSGFHYEKPEGVNYWIVKVYSDNTDNSYIDAVQKALQCSVEQRWSSIAICLMHGQDALPFKKQIIHIRDFVNCLKKNRYLQVIKLVILNREIFETMVAETQEKESKQFQLSSFVAGFFNQQKNHWKVVHNSDVVQSPRLLISAIGEDESTLNTMKDKLRDAIEYVVRKI